MVAKYCHFIYNGTRAQVQLTGFLLLVISHSAHHNSTQLTETLFQDVFTSLDLELVTFSAGVIGPTKEILLQHQSLIQLPQL